MVKNKLLKKVAAAAMAMAMTFATVPMGVMAAHTRPDGRICDNTIRSYECGKYVTNMSQGSHTATGGYVCLISGLVYEHTIRCSSCKTVTGTSSYTCTIAHSKCGTKIVNHPAY